MCVRTEVDRPGVRVVRDASFIVLLRLLRRGKRPVNRSGFTLPFYGVRHWFQGQAWGSVDERSADEGPTAIQQFGIAHEIVIGVSENAA